eukprot:COSAG03_NODE_5554_length_1221_cov_1.006239_3_plen_115_part_01
MHSYPARLSCTFSPQLLALLIACRWGRNSNSPSEDPLLTGMYGKYLVMGTQTNKDGVNLINSQMKHWTAYGVEKGRMGFNGNVSVHDMSETYMVPLHIMLQANVSSAMCVRPVRQ